MSGPRIGHVNGHVELPQRSPPCFNRLPPRAASNLTFLEDCDDSWFALWQWNSGILATAKSHRPPPRTGDLARRHRQRSVGCGTKITCTRAKSPGGGGANRGSRHFSGRNCRVATTLVPDREPLTQLDRIQPPLRIHLRLAELQVLIAAKKSAAITRRSQLLSDRRLGRDEAHRGRRAEVTVRINQGPASSETA
jgi:hypothetical protein